LINLAILFHRINTADVPVIKDIFEKYNKKFVKITEEIFEKYNEEFEKNMAVRQREDFVGRRD